MITIVNIVGSGSLNAEFNLESVSKDLGSVAEYNSEKYPGMYLRFRDNEPLITVYRTGKYIITGPESEEEAYSIRDRFLSLLAEKGMIESPADEWFRIQNVVCTSDLGQSLNLTALTIGLGLEQTEYEPEQFPGLVYRPPDYDCVILVFSSGKIVITGSKDIEVAEAAVTAFRQRISEYT